jgi:DNA polymerase
MTSSTDAAAEARALAREFARALEHLRKVGEVGYVHASAMPAAEAARAAQPQTAATPVAPAPASLPVLHDAAPAPARVSGDADSWSAATKLEYLRRKNLGDCRRCPLAKTRTHIVFGVGNPRADIMFVGEAPGADEDRAGEPFVGRAGQRLDEWITAIGLRREDVYIANVLKCRPPGNRDPRPEEVDKCSPFLQAQIRAIAPKVIVALGRHAGMLLARRDDLSLRAMRSARLTYDVVGKDGSSTTQRIPLVVTYHPAYVLRQESDAPGVDSHRPSNRSARKGPGVAGVADESPTAESGAQALVFEDLRRALAIVGAANSRAR